MTASSAALLPAASASPLLLRLSRQRVFRCSYLIAQGTFALVCLDVEFPHPLNSRLLAFKWRSPVVHPLISSFQSQDSQLGVLQLTEEALVRVPQKGLRDYLENVTAEDANAEHILGHVSWCSHVV